MNIKQFDMLNVSSKFAICGLPIRVDTYKTCSFGCKYCFSNCRKIMEFTKELQVGNISKLQRKLKKIFDDDKIDSANFLEVLVKQGVTWHCGGMSDPFQSCEKRYGITKSMIDITSKYGTSILFSTKSDNLYGANIRPDLHTFQFSVTNTSDMHNIEPNVPDIEKRYKLYRELKDNGFRVGIRIQPFIPSVSTLDIVEMFADADNFTIEGIKIVPQNLERKNFVLSELGLSKEDFTQMGLLNLKSEIRYEMYKPFIKYFTKYKIPFSIADNDLHYVGTNNCCCGDKLISKSTTFNNTYLLKQYGRDYNREQLQKEIDSCDAGCCKCNQLFTSNRQEGCVTVNDFYDKRFDRKSSPFSPQFQYYTKENNNE